MKWSVMDLLISCPLDLDKPENRSYVFETLRDHHLDPTDFSGEGVINDFEAEKLVDRWYFEAEHREGTTE